MSISAQLLWVLSGLGAAAFAASGRSNLRLLAGILAGFVAAAFFIHPQRLPEAGWVGGGVALVAAGQIFQPRWVRWIVGDAVAIASGMLTGILAALLQMDGLPLWAGLAIAAMLPAVTIWLSSRNATFAPPVLQEEGLLFMLLLGLASAVVPSLLEGWQSAAVMNARAVPLPGAKVVDGSLAMPAWVLATSGLSVAFGGIWAVWRHR